jgi:hypothetical protein
MSINKIKRPVVMKDHDAIYVLLVRLLLLEPGTNQAFPTMGVGLVSHYRYSFSSDLNKLISRFIPDLASSAIDVLAEVKSHALVLKVNVDDEVIYPIVINTDTMQLSDLANGGNE